MIIFQVCFIYLFYGSIISFSRVCLGVYLGVFICLILNFSVNSCMILFTNSVPLSVWSTRGVPQRDVIRLWNCDLIVFLFAFLIGMISTHLVKRSRNTNIYWFFPFLLNGSGPMMSAATMVHGYSMSLSPISPSFAWLLDFVLWQILQFFTYLITSE